MGIMSRNLEEIEHELMGLDPRTRATLASRLLESLENLSDEENESLWIAEAESRYGEYLAGRTRATEGDEVFRKARARSK